MPRQSHLCIAILPIALTLAGCTPPRHVQYLPPGEIPQRWLTHAERTDYAQTGRYDEVVTFCRQLADASPHARYTTFGRSSEGRDLPLLILSRDNFDTPAAAHRADKPVILIQNCIHAGECAGKDASLALARDILITGTHADLLDHAQILLIPIFNTDGHERFSPYSRINQNGPAEMGWRVTATNLNLNRDYTKADAVEMQAWLRLWTAYSPDLLIDNHTTNGSDHGYDLLYAATSGPSLPQSLAQWVSDVWSAEVPPALDAAGYPCFPYSGPRDWRDVSAGLDAVVHFTPRFSTGYAAACNRAGILVEAHALKPYKRRVLSTYCLLLQTLRSVNAHANELRDAVRQADEACTRYHGADLAGSVPVDIEHSDQSRTVTYKSLQSHIRPSAITGDDVIEYTSQPADTQTQLFDQPLVTASVTPPAAYLIPPQWRAVIDRLQWHGIPLQRLSQSMPLTVECYRLDEVTFAPRPFEGRQMPHYTSTAFRTQRTFPAGTVVVRLNHPRAKLAVNLLEPSAPDSLLAWGLFNTIFEQKEYAEAYVMAPIARRMLADDPALRAAFEQRLHSDTAFAESPHQRLDFFYQRSPYADEALGVYPVARFLDQLPTDSLMID